MTAILFMDTETTGLSLEDDVWEFAAIRREEDGRETEHHLFIEHDRRKCQQLPDSFKADHLARWPGCDAALSQENAAHAIHALTADRPRIVGAITWFDMQRIEVLLRTHNLTPQWQYRLRCVENLTAGHLRRDVDGLAECAKALGIEVDETARHTAMGDARLAMAVYDRVMGVSGD